MLHLLALIFCSIEGSLYHTQQLFLIQYCNCKLVCKLPFFQRRCKIAVPRTVFTRLEAAAYRFFSSFRAVYNQGWLISCIYIIFYLVERYRWRPAFPWLRFFQPNSFHVVFSAASRAHPLLERVWWTEGSCSGVNIITRVTNNASTRKYLRGLGNLCSRAAYINF